MAAGHCLPEYLAVWLWHHGPYPDHLTPIPTNGNRRDPRIENLRLVPIEHKTDRLLAKTRRNSSGIVGVSCRPEGYRCTLGRQELGTFRDLAAAKAVRQRAERTEFPYLRPNT